MFDIYFKDKIFFINEKPFIIMSGEIHYYRLKKQQWQTAIDELKNCGMNTVATYIPWLCHELYESNFDLTGETYEQFDITSFIDLCQKNNLYVIVRPGPFVMAEMKNEGIPFWVYKKYPHLIPKTWDGKIATTKTLDYLHQDFLDLVYKWYEKIMPLIAKNLLSNGGKIIGVQLDNEVGMLSWVSNCPDLTDFNLSEFIFWLKEKYCTEDIFFRYGFDIENFDLVKVNFRSPKENIVLKYHHDLGNFMRFRFAKYLDTLKKYANSFGVKDVPFFINIHGSGGNRGFNYPIGLSQLYESYKNISDTVSSIDYYIGDIHIGNYADIYLSNIFTDATNSCDQPLTALEFEAGDGNYGFNLDTRYNPSSNNIKTRMFLAQGHKLLNYYLFSGGENLRLDIKLNDGNDRIAITGQKHGFAAPIDFNLQRTSSYDITNKVVNTIIQNQDILSTMKPVFDNIIFSFVPDYFMIEYFYPKSSLEIEFINSLKRIAMGNMWNVYAKSLLLLNYNFKAFDIQNNCIDDCDISNVLIFASAKYVSKNIQEKVISFINKGGNALIFGEIPEFDFEGNSCRLLLDFLEIEPLKFYNYVPEHHTSVYPCGRFSENVYEIICQNNIQTYKVFGNYEPILRVYENDELCGFIKNIKNIKNSKVAVISAPFNCQLNFFKLLYEELGIKKSLYHDFDYLNGIWLAKTINDSKEEIIHVINLDENEKLINIFENGENIFNRKILLKNRECIMLPFNINPLKNINFTIKKSTAEIFSKDKNYICFRLTQNTDFIEFKTTCKFDIIVSEEEKKYLFVKNHEEIFELSVQSKKLDSDILKIVFYF